MRRTIPLPMAAWSTLMLLASGPAWAQPAPQPVPAPPPAPTPAPAPAAPAPGAASPTAPPGTLPPGPPQGFDVVLPSETDEEDDDEDHDGSFARLTAGLGLAHVSGSLPPKPGFKPVDPLSYTAPALGVAAQVGGGVHNFAIAGELFYERMLRRLQEPSKVSFSLIGLGVTASLYLDEDWYVTGHLRWVFGLLYKSEIPCWVDRIDGTSGPGFGLTLGKEWFGHDDHDEHDEDNDGGLGLALQLNYASLSGEPSLKYVSGLVLLSMTHF